MYLTKFSLVLFAGEFVSFLYNLVISKKKMDFDVNNIFE